MIVLAVITAIAAMAITATSCGGAATGPGTSTTASTSLPAPEGVDARSLYSANCAVCHGTNRQGVNKVGPPLTASTLAGIDQSELRRVISEGRPNTAMAGFKGRLGPDQIDALAQLVAR